MANHGKVMRCVRIVTERNWEEFAVLHFWVVGRVREADPPWSGLWPPPMGGANRYRDCQTMGSFPHCRLGLVASRLVWCNVLAHSEGAKRVI
jgi:hypothetical protein